MAEVLSGRERQPRHYRARKDFFNELSDKELIKRYRLNRAGILHVTDLVRTSVQNGTRRSQALTAEMKIIITLNFLATGTMQHCSCDDLGVSQSTISRAIAETLDALSDSVLLRQYIKFPVTAAQVERKKGEFQPIAHFPGVIGVIDCVHIRISALKQQDASFLNSKGYYSINMQFIFDANCRIINVLAKWPGSVHDSRIFNESGVKKLFDRDMVPAGCHLLGDADYPCHQCLLTPYTRPQPGPQGNYNRAHKKIWSVTERGIDQLRRRFRVLRQEIRLEPVLKVCKVVEVCALLHNICMDMGIGMPAEDHDNISAAADDDDDEEEEEEDDDEEEEEEEGGVDPGDALPPVPEAHLEDLQYRDGFCNLYFKRSCLIGIKVL
ncbi:putative nuclease HARBI1 [Chionoecetes opilio]|uniref:Putative nuclease HARBI1 n=1 Tax=Chionoecetes opilio TaxID=41210 RepID=A0A8J5CKY9_CHIOP|nr:putative nuclease HARBI1 [Chionoecetes opilio]